MHVKVAKNSYFSIALLWVALILLALTMSYSAIAYDILFSNHGHASLDIDTSSEQVSSCSSIDCDHFTYTHKHRSDEDNKEEHEHTHVIHLSHGEFLSLGSQTLQMDISRFLAVSPLLALALQPAFFPKIAYASIFRPPIA
ncbi:MAG: hypothetical protein BWZ03_00784 [bacterium ADurb.BinA186]|nr:MAG: hypothetical protein BWZ03_00784 [bacterium ADurb.BinA186]